MLWGVLFIWFGHALFWRIGGLAFDSYKRILISLTVACGCDILVLNKKHVENVENYTTFSDAILEEWFLKWG